MRGNAVGKKNSQEVAKDGGGGACELCYYERGGQRMPGGGDRRMREKRMSGVQLPWQEMSAKRWQRAGKKKRGPMLQGKGGLIFFIGGSMQTAGKNFVYMWVGTCIGTVFKGGAEDHYTQCVGGGT